MNQTVSKTSSNCIEFLVLRITLLTVATFCYIRIFCFSFLNKNNYFTNFFCVLYIIKITHFFICKIVCSSANSILLWNILKHIYQTFYEIRKKSEKCPEKEIRSLESEADVRLHVFLKCEKKYKSSWVDCTNIIFRFKNHGCANI